MNGQQADGTFKVEKVESKKPQLHATSLNMKCME
jgi:hypothetical protein